MSSPSPPASAPGPSIEIPARRATDTVPFPPVDLGLGVGPSMRGVTVRQLDVAGTTLADEDRGPDGPSAATSFGEAQRSIERVIALNRLVRREVGRRAHREEGAVLRHCLTHLGPACSALRLITTLDDLAGQYQDALAPTAFSVTRVHLVDRGEQRRAELTGQAAIDLRITIGAARARYAAWDPDLGNRGKRAAGPVNDDLTPILDELSRSYDRGRRALERAYAEPRARNFRRWHRRVRRLDDQLLLAESLDPMFVGAHRSLLGQLDALLEHHDDLVRLSTLVRTDPDATADERERTLLLVLIERARVEVQWEARPLGRRAYAEQTDAFASRLDAYWEAGRALL